MKKYLENFHPRWRHSVRTRWNIDIKMSSAEKLFISFTESASKPRRFILLKTEKKTTGWFLFCFFFQANISTTTTCGVFIFLAALLFFCFLFFFYFVRRRRTFGERRPTSTPFTGELIHVIKNSSADGSRGLKDGPSLGPAAQKKKQNTHEIPTIGKRRRASFVTAKGFEVHALDTQTVKRNSTRSTQ